MVMTGRTHQKERTRAAIVAAAQDLVDSGQEVTMPAIAAAALVSEATAYRYFPDLVTLLGEVTSGVDAEQAMAAVADSVDPVERVGHATEMLARHVLQRQAAIRAIMSAAIVRPGPAVRPGYRFTLIEKALSPWSETAHHDQVEQLTRALAVVVSADALFTLTDLCGLSDEAAIASLVHTARTVTAATTA
jgi:AcrR family transcriptional regulator